MPILTILALQVLAAPTAHAAPDTQGAAASLMSCQPGATTPESQRDCADAELLRRDAAVRAAYDAAMAQRDAPSRVALRREQLEWASKRAERCPDPGPLTPASAVDPNERTLCLAGESEARAEELGFEARLGLWRVIGASIWLRYAVGGILALGLFWGAVYGMPRVRNYARGKILTWAHADATTVKFATNVLRWVAIPAAGVIALGFFGIESTSLSALIGATGLVISFALQGQLANVSAGVLLATTKPFRVGTRATIGANVYGWIDEIDLLFTCVDTEDGRRVMVPNNAVVTSTIEVHEQPEDVELRSEERRKQLKQARRTAAAVVDHGARDARHDTLPPHLPSGPVTTPEPSGERGETANARVAKTYPSVLTLKLSVPASRIGGKPDALCGNLAAEVKAVLAKTNLVAGGEEGRHGVFPGDVTVSFNDFDGEKVTVAVRVVARDLSDVGATRNEVVCFLMSKLADTATLT
jgi:small-conductance mechanosensitive channel/uncharacterized protein YecT (DUF1311 family)